MNVLCLLTLPACPLRDDRAGATAGAVTGHRRPGEALLHAWAPAHRSATGWERAAVAAAQGLVPPARNQTGFGMAEAGVQHLPALTPHAAALPSLGALAAGCPCRGATHTSHSRLCRPSAAAAGAYSSSPERPPGAAGRGRWGRSAARVSLGRVVP